MKKTKREKDATRDEYLRADFPAGLERGKYAARAKAGTNIAVLEPESAAAFPNSAAVNDAARHAVHPI